MRPVLEVENLELEFIKEDKHYKALNKISFQVNQGEIVGIVGESGCGKSITSLSIMGLLPPNAFVSGGKILLGKNDLLRLREEEIRNLRGRQLSMIFQEPMTALNPVLTVGRQISETLYIHQKMNKKEVYESVIHIMRKVGLPRAEMLYKEYPHQLSGGMRQRIMIAMALVNRPYLLIADEPTTALDVTIQAQILGLIKQMNQEIGTSVIYISHDLGVVRELCSRVMIMYAGNIVEEGPVEAVFKNPLHPYTRGLISSIPTIGKKEVQLHTIRGTVPSIYERCATGCSFVNRCDISTKACAFTDPVMQEFQQHRVLCHQVMGKEVGEYAQKLNIS